MHNPMKKTDIEALLIDPFERTVTSIRIPKHTGDSSPLQWAAMKAALRCDYLETIPLGSLSGVHQSLWLDEEGMLNKPWDEQAFFTLSTAPDQHLAGYALVCGLDGAGNIVRTSIDVARMARHVRWLAPQAVVVPRTTVQTLDENMRPVGPKETIGGGKATWTYQDQPR